MEDAPAQGVSDGDVGGAGGGVASFGTSGDSDDQVRGRGVGVWAFRTWVCRSERVAAWSAWDAPLMIRGVLVVLCDCVRGCGLRWLQHAARVTVRW